MCTCSTYAFLFARWRAWAFAFLLRSRSFWEGKEAREVGVEAGAARVTLFDGGDIMYGNNVSK